VAPDEISYLAQASYFAGNTETPDVAVFFQESGLNSLYSNDKKMAELRSWPYYHFGYSLIISPAYLFAETPIGAYKGVMLINSLVLSSLFIILFLWLRMVTSIPPITVMMIAFIISVYPPNVLHAHIGWAENAFIPFFSFSCLLFTLYVKEKNLLWLIAFSLVAGFMYTIHPRGLSISLAAVICLLFFSVLNKKEWRNSLMGVLLISLVVVLTKYTSNELSSLMNVSSTSQADKVLSLIKSIGDLELVSPIVGDFLYLILATLGMVIFGIFALIKQLNYKNKQLKELFQSDQAQLSSFILISCIITFTLGVVFLARTEEWHALNLRLDWIMYGRYNDGLVSVVMALGLAWLYDQDKAFYAQHKRTFGYGFILVGLVMLTFIVTHDNFHGLRDLHTYGIFPWYFMAVYTEGFFRILPLFLGPLMWSWIILNLFIQNKIKGLIVYAVYFLLMDISLIIYINQRIATWFNLS
jgi:hypothetical protein